MTKQTIIGSIVVIVLAGGLFYFYAPSSMKFWKGQTAAVINSGEDNSSASPHETINAKHQFKNGTHVVAGEANSPTPCDILTTTTQIAQSQPEQVTINFVSKTNGDACAQVVTSNRFKVGFQASENATISATWNGKPVQLNLVPASSDEDLQNFEIFIKG